MPATLSVLMFTIPHTEVRGNSRPPAWALVAGMTVVVAVAGLVYGFVRPGGGGSSAPWKPVWAADFGGPAGGGIDSGAWKFDTGYGVFGTQEVETMTSSARNVHVDGHGDLSIVVLGHGASSGEVWTSGRIQTRRLFAPPAGGAMMVTGVIRQPDPSAGAGYWPAFWMLGPGPWPSSGEIDILEDVNGLSTHSGTLHCGNLTAGNGDGTFGPCREKNGLGSGRLPCPGCQTGFHSYSVVIDRRDTSDEQIRWYLDGRQFFSVSESSVGAPAWHSAVDHGFSILLNVAVGGAYPDITCGCASPSDRTSSGGTMTVRSLAVYVST